MIAKAIMNQLMAISKMLSCPWNTFWYIIIGIIKHEKVPPMAPEKFTNSAIFGMIKARTPVNKTRTVRTT